MSVNLATGEVDVDGLNKMAREKLDAFAELLGIKPDVFTTRPQLIEAIRAVVQVHAGKSDAQKLQAEMSRPESVSLGTIACKGKYRIDEKEPNSRGETIHRCKLRQNLRWTGDNGCVGCEKIHDKLTKKERDAIVAKNAE
jgi:hypothetical protein